MKGVLIHCFAAVLFVSLACSNSKELASGKMTATQSARLSSEEEQQVQEKLSLLQDLSKTGDATEIKANFADDIVVAGYEEPFASLIMDAAAPKWKETVTKMEMIRAEKTADGIKVTLNIEVVESEPQTEETERYFVLNSSYEFAELHLFKANVNVK